MAMKEWLNEATKALIVRIVSLAILATVAAVIYVATMTTTKSIELTVLLEGMVLQQVYRWLPMGSAEDFDKFYKFMKDWLGGAIAKDERASASTTLILIFAMAVIIAVVAIYLLKVDMAALYYLAVAAVGGAVAWATLKIGGKTVAKGYVGVSIVDDRYSGTGKAARIAYNVWMSTYGMANVIIGTIPAGLHSVYIDDNQGFTADLYYDEKTNRLYATEACPLFKERETEEQIKERNYLKIRNAYKNGENPFQVLYDLCGKAAKDLVAGKATGVDYERAVEAALNLPGDDRTPLEVRQAVHTSMAVEAYCRLVEWQVPGPR
jgi:hypothetical protein